jgi:hypothetical protein
MADEKKIIIDEDWKERVEAEKLQAQAEPADKSVATGEGDSQKAADFPMPPASFELLLTTLATEALIALGQVPHPATGQLQSHRNHARYLIDTIDILRDKTKGNLTPPEEETIDALLHQLRMAYVAQGG